MDFLEGAGSMTLSELRTVARFRGTGSYAHVPALGPADNPVILWLLAQLHLKADFQVDQPVRDQWGASIPVRHGRAQYQVTLGLEDATASTWVVAVQDPPRVLAGRWIRREPQAQRELIEFLHDALSNEPDVRDLAWHQSTAYGQGDYTAGAPSPAGQKVNARR